MYYNIVENSIGQQSKVQHSYYSISIAQCDVEQCSVISNRIIWCGVQGFIFEIECKSADRFDVKQILTEGIFSIETQVNLMTLATD